jgi:aspartate carbamoyltransferase catalytic subunit
MKHVLSVKQFLDKDLLASLFSRADQFQAMPAAEYPKPLEHMTLATVFYEPSTRTRLSFETAIQNLGAHLVTVENAADNSSWKKGESIEDTAHMLNAYVEGIVMRHPEIGMPARAAAVSKVPVFNAGDGGGEHPTQALLDLYSIQRMKGKVDGLKIALVGDLAHSRTHHSLANILSIYDVELFLISPESLAMPEDVLANLTKQGVTFHILTSWDDVIGDLDVIYMNRVQKERFKLIEEYQALKGSFILTNEIANLMKKDAIILDPLPRIEEITVEVDSNPRAQYFQQAKNGLYLRMALLEYIYTS